MKKYKNTFRFSVAHAIKKNFILPLATFVLSMILFLLARKGLSQF